MTRHASSARSRARRLALQALYQWQVGRQNPKEIEVQLTEAGSTKNLDLEYFQTLFRSIPAESEALEESLAPQLDRPVAQLDPVERAILLIGTFELTCRMDVPSRVILNEAVELAKRFGAEQSHRIVNGVLDKVARVARGREMAE